MDEGKGTAFVVLGVVAIIAVVGLVLLLTSNKGSTGKIVTMAGCDSPATYTTEDDVKLYAAAGYVCEKSAGGVDVYGQQTWCCTPPSGVPVNQRYKGVPILG